MGEGQAFDLVVQGSRFSASEALRLGIATRVFEAFTFRADAENYLAALAAKPGSAVTLSKRLLYDLDGLDFDAGLERAAEVNAEARQTEACREGVRGFLDKSDS
jgi:enoyl-CoA hydratase/carnithine racemase